jgi:hypothetical protein
MRKRRSVKGSVAIGAALVLAVAVGALMVGSSIAGSIVPAVSGPPALFKLHAAVELTSGNPQDNGVFGEAVAIGGGCVAVGAPFEKLPGADAEDGNVYLFNSTTGQPTQTLSSPNARADGWFGWAVAMSGTNLVVGAPNETARGALAAGNAYTYTFTSACVATLESTLPEPTPQAAKHLGLDGGEFGESVAISGSDVIVGASNETSHALRAAGNAYLFSTSGTWLSTLTSPNAAANGSYGRSVALAGTTAYVGAPLEGSGGHVYIVFKATGAASGTTTYTLASPRLQGGGPYASGYFGYSIAVAGNYLVVGAPQENVSANTSSGNAYVFNTTTGLLDVGLPNPTPASYGIFGDSVAVSGADIAVGASNEADANGDRGGGNVTVYDALTGTVLNELASPNSATDGYFGYTVAAGDGEIVVGAPTETAFGVAEAGHAYLF